MSFLSDTQGRPPRVLSTATLLETYGPMQSDSIRAWLQPNAGEDSTSSAVPQTLGVMRSMGLIEGAADGSHHLVTPIAAPKTTQLGDMAHAYLASADDADEVFFQAYAALLVECDFQSDAAWLDDLNNSELADHLEAMIGDGAGATRKFNSTKLAPWWDWLEFMGLVVRMPNDKYQPSVVHRLERLIESEALEGEMSSKDFLALVAERMPYCDGGAHREWVSGRDSRKTPDSLSWGLSMGLRNLHDLDVLSLVQLGDAREGRDLFPNRIHDIKYFTSVRFS